MARYAPPVAAPITYAQRTDPGRKRLANEDACAAHPAQQLFLVCDGVGGRPAGEAASNLVAHALPRRLPHTITSQTLAAAAAQLSDQLHALGQSIPGLKGMACTLVAAHIHQHQLHLVWVGDSRAYLRRSTQLIPLTQDQSKAFRALDKPTDAPDRRLLADVLGTAQTPAPATRSVALEPGDRLLLCTDGVTDPLTEPQIGQILLHAEQPEHACQQLIDAANAAGGPDNITASVIDIHRLDALPSPLAQDPAPLSRCPEDVLAALDQLIKDLTWLLAGVKELQGATLIAASAAVKRRLGRDAYQRFLAMQAGRNPLHVYHRACTDPAFAWRKAYTQHLAALEPRLHDLTRSAPRLSPSLTGQESAELLHKLWQSWRGVEGRYFDACQRGDITTRDTVLTYLIQHMRDSARTLRGLLDALPRLSR